MECTSTAFPYVQILKTIHFYGYLCRRFIFSEQMHEFTGGRVLLIPGINIYIWVYIEEYVHRTRK